MNFYRGDMLLESQPSWVADFRNQVSLDTGRTTITTHAPRFSPEGQNLIIEGCQVGKVLASSDAGITDAQDLRGQILATRRFHDTILACAADIPQ